MLTDGSRIIVLHKRANFSFLKISATTYLGSTQNVFGSPNPKAKFIASWIVGLMYYLAFREETLSVKMCHIAPRSVYVSFDPLAILSKAEQSAFFVEIQQFNLREWTRAVINQ